MDFGEAAGRYTELQVQRQNGSLSDQQYRTLIDQLRVQDTRGTWWQPEPGGTGWIFWNGTQWQPGTPTLPAQMSPVPPATPGQHPRDAAGKQDFSQFRSGIMDKEAFNRISKSVPWNKRPQQWWDRFSLTLGIVVAVVWFVYSSLTPLISLVTRGVMTEEFDLISPLLMVAMPVFLIWKRKEIDNLLMPLQPSRKKLSQKLLIGMGIAIPFLTAFILYHIFQVSQYPLMYINIVIGTLISYMLVREPVLADQYRRNPHTGRTPDFRVPLFLLIGISVIVRVVLADDCLTDPLNARDCMRTTGTAELLSGGVSSGVSVAVNGPTMVQSLQDGGGSEGGSSGGSGGDPGDGGPLDNMDLCFDEGF